MSTLQELEEQFEKVTKEVRALVKLHKKHMKYYSETPAKRERVEEEEEELSPKKPKKEESADFTCEGRLWEDAPCPGGKRANQKAGILYEKKRRIVCKECKLAYGRLKKKQKKESKE